MHPTYFTVFTVFAVYICYLSEFPQLQDTKTNQKHI